MKVDLLKVDIDKADSNNSKLGQISVQIMMEADKVVLIRVED